MVIDFSPQEKDLLIFCISNLSIKGSQPNAVEIAKLCESLMKKLGATREEEWNIPEQVGANHRNETPQ